MAHQSLSSGIIIIISLAPNDSNDEQRHEQTKGRERPTICLSFRLIMILLDTIEITTKLPAMTPAPQLS